MKKILLSLGVIAAGSCLYALSPMEEDAIGYTATSNVSIRAIASNKVAKPVGPFSTAVLAENVQETLYISGQLPTNTSTPDLEADPEKATEQIMNNLAAILQEADMDFSHVVKTTIMLADIKDFQKVNKVYESFLDKSKPYPARSTFQVGALPRGGRVEIEMTAVK